MKETIRGLGWPLHKITMETDVQRKTIITGDFSNIYIGNVTPKLALSLNTFEQLTLLMVNGPSDFNYETFLSDMPCTLSYHTTGNHFAHPKYSNI